MNPPFFVRIADVAPRGEEEALVSVSSPCGKPGAAPWHAGLRLTDSRSLASSWGSFTAEDAEIAEKGRVWDYGL